MNYQALLTYFPWANAVYGKTDANPAPIAVGNSAAVAVEGFIATPGSGFDGALYKDPSTGRYTIAFAGSVQLGADWLGADPTLVAQRITAIAGEWAGSWHPQMTDGLNFAYAAAKQIRSDLRLEGIDQPTMDQIRARLDVTGHSLGGALAEMVSKFFGLRGANIDGPGVSTLVGLSPFTQMQDKVAADSELPGFQRDYQLKTGDFTANAFSVVGMAGTHLEGISFDAETKASVSFYAGSTLIVLGTQTGGLTSLAGLGVLANSVTDHPMGAILGKIESNLNLPTVGSLPTVDAVGLGNAPLGGLGDAPQLDLFYKTPSATTYAVATKWIANTQFANVAAGLSPSGIPLDGTAVARGSYTVIAFRDEATGRINEIYTPLQGGAPVKREFVVATDGQVGTFTKDGKLQFLVSGDDGVFGIAELQPDNRMLFSSFTTTGYAQTHGYSPDADTAGALRSGGISLRQNMEDLARRIFGSDADDSLTLGGQKMQANQLEQGGLLYNADVNGNYVRNLGSGLADVIDGQGNRYLQDANGNRTPVNNDQAITLSDTGTASIVPRQRIDEASLTGQPQVIIFQDNGVATRLDLDASGQLVRKSTLQTFDDGSLIATTTLPSGSITALTTNADGSLYQKSTTTPDKYGNTDTVVTNGAGQLLSQTQTEYFYDETGVSRTETISTASGTVRKTYDSDGSLFKTETLADPASLAASRSAQVAQELISFTQLLGSKAPGALKLASGAVLLNRVLNTPDASGQVAYPNFGTAATVAAGAISLYNLNQAFKNGDGLAKVTATASTLNFVNQTFIGNTALGTTLNGTGLANGVPGVLPALGLISAIKAKDPVGMVQSSIALFNPALLYNPALGFTPLGWVMLAAAVLKALSEKGPPDAWGVANVSFGPGITHYGSQVNATGENFGPQRVRAQLQGTLDGLNSLIAQHNAGKPDSTQHLGLIPQRMPALNFKAAEFADKGYAVTDIDALTGAQRHAQLRFDDDGQLFGIEPAAITPELRAMLGVQGAPGYPQLAAYMLNSALERQAIAPLWEVKTAKLQQEAGDPNAGLSEEERAAKAGLAAALDSAYAAAHPSDAKAGHKRVGHFMPIGIDLDRNGAVSTLSIEQTESANTPVSFDWDGLGYQKKVGWVAANDGLLVLDRNFNGSVDNASELLSNPLVADAAKGLRSLAAFDANADGRIDQNDPVHQQLKVWQDFDQDGNNTHGLTIGGHSEIAQDESNGIKELRSLSDWGITAIDYANGRYEFASTSRPNGVGYASISTQTLEAEQEGVLYTPVGAGIRIDATDGKPEIVITQVQSEQAVYAQYTLEAAGETIGTPQAPLYEDGTLQAYNPNTQGGPIAITISAAQLLGNDTWHGAAGSAAGLTITGVGNASHLGSLSLTAEGHVSLTLEANYNGAAGFDYTVTSPDGQARTARVNLNITSVNDVPSVAVQLDQQSIFGYGVLATGDLVGNGEDRMWAITSVQRNIGLPLDRPYQTVLGRQQVGTQVVGNGEDAQLEPVFGALADTLIPKSYFDSQYATVLHAHQDPESGPPPTFLQFDMDGTLFKVEANAATVWHDVPLAVEPTNAGYVSATDPDGAAQFSYEVVMQPLYGSVSLNPTTGRFDYAGRRYVGQNVKGEQINQNVVTEDAARNEQRFTDYFTVRAHDGSGGSVDKEIGVTHYGPPANPAVEGSGGKKPIAIDLDGNGFEFTDVDDSNVFFDVNGDGWKRKMAWTKPGDGLIAFDKDGNGKIESFDEIAYVGYAPGQQTDLAALRQAFDTDHNGVLDAGDAKWSQFGVWQDANSNGVNDDGEYRSLSDMGISAIGLASDGRFQVIDGQTVHGLAVATKTDGSTLAVADVTLRTSNQAQVPTANPDGTTGTTTVSVPKYGKGQEFVGTADKDLVFGTAASDAFRTGEGDDVIVDDGGNDGVEAGAGNDLIYSGIDNDIVNAGAGNDTVLAGAGNDLVFGDGADESGDDLIMMEDGNDVAFGGAGSDFIGGGLGNDVLSGNTGDDKLFGEDGWDALFGQEGDDELWGMAGNDLLYGEQGNDVLAGGEGDDAMEGGAGDDTYEVDSFGDTVTELAGEGTDTVNASISYALGGNLENLTLTGADHLKGTGNAADNLLIGNAGNNALTGLAGSDTLDGGLGADSLIGGVGDDTYIVDNASDQVVEVAGEGVDTVRSRISYSLAAHVENLTLVGINAINGTGNELDNALVGNVAANVLDGGAGADVMRGGRGNDTYVVDNAGDVVMENAEEGVDTVLASTSYTLSAHVENLTLTGNAAAAIGNELDNALHGNVQANLLDGAAGTDVMIGGEGDDTYSVDQAGDVVVEADGEGDDTVVSAIGYTLGANLENLTLMGNAVSATGNGQDNILMGNAQANLLDGAAGADQMAGSAGDDTYIVDEAGDRVVELAGEGHDTVLASVSHALSANVENLSLTGTADIHATGNALDNLIMGNSGANVLDGGAGADRLIGGAGDDVYRVDNMGDSVVEQAGEGLDTVLASVSYGLSAHAENLSLTGAADLSATGNELDNMLTGNSGNNTLDGGAGADTMAGGLGHDVYVVDHPNDTVIEAGDEGVDTVLASVSYSLSAHVDNLSLTGTADLSATGNELDNVLTGNRGANRLDGGAGADLMAGDAGDDTYVVDNALDIVAEQTGAGNDTVLSSVSYTLSANVENLSLTGTADLAATGNELNNMLGGNDGSNWLDGGAGTDLMAGGLGDDIYVVDDAGDGVVEWSGAGTDTVLAGINYVLPQHVENLRLAGAALTATGNALDNQLHGNALGNLFDGAAGADLMAGGAGNDTYVVDNAGDIVVEAIDEGNDIVLSSVSYALSDNVEGLRLTGSANLAATGNMLGNVITGNAGNNLIDGGAGVDALAGGAGDDRYVVDDVLDTVTEAAGEGLDTIEASVNYSLISQVENLVLTGGATRAVGNELDNRLSGNALDNLLDGAAGADVMAGGAGHDTYVVDNAGDTVAESFGEGTDTVLSSVSYTLSAHVESLTLTGGSSISATANELDNTLTGNTGNNALTGGAGNDTYVYQLGGGLDTITDISGTDTVRFGPGLTLDNVALRIATVAGQKVAQIRVLDASGNEIPTHGIDYVMEVDARNRLTSPLENFVFTDGSTYLWNDLLIQSTSLTGINGADLLVGGRNDDLIDGGNGNDTLYGGSGHDRLWGGNGNDVLFGGGGNDKLYGGNGDDELYGEAGDDLLDGGNGQDLLIDLQGNNTFYTGNDDDTVMAGAGHDLIYTDNGRDIVQSGAGVDRIDTGNEADLVDAGAGNDVIVAGNGADWIAAGKGNDLINAGHDRNLFAFNKGDGQDAFINSQWGNDAVSLGHGIRYADLKLLKTGNDLVLDMGSGDSMTLKDWYASNQNKGIGTLQVVTVGGDYDANSTDKTRNKQVEAFDFAKLVQKFDAARALNSANANGWAVMNSLLDAHLQGSNTAALGGDLNYQYATTGSLSGIGLAAAQSSLASGPGWQTLKSRSQLEQDAVRLA